MIKITLQPLPNLKSENRTAKIPFTQNGRRKRLEFIPWKADAYIDFDSYVMLNKLDIAFLGSHAFLYCNAEFVEILACSIKENSFGS